MGEPNLTTEQKPEPEKQTENEQKYNKISPNYKGRNPWGKNKNTQSSNKNKSQNNKSLLNSKIHRNLSFSDILQANIYLLHNLYLEVKIF